MGAHHLLSKTLDGRSEQVQLARAESATGKLVDQLDQLVEALRLFDPPSGAPREVVELAPLFALFEAEFAEAARLKGVRLRILATRALVLGNPVLLRSILRNLIRNAIDYTPAGGSVVVAARRRGGAVHLEVRDNGVGIPARDLADIFKPFHRADDTRTDGLGLGLFIVKCAAAFLAYPLEVQSALGKGSRFTVVSQDARQIGQSLGRARPPALSSEIGLL
jgi:signal transduction histidine kinase